MSTLRCLYCGGLIRLKENCKNGTKFWGCLRWPKCGFAESEKDHSERHLIEVIGDHPDEGEWVWNDPWIWFD